MIPSYDVKSVVSLTEEIAKVLEKYVNRTIDHALIFAIRVDVEQVLNHLFHGLSLRSTVHCDENCIEVNTVHRSGSDWIRDVEFDLIDRMIYAVSDDGKRESIARLTGEL